MPEMLKKRRSSPKLRSAANISWPLDSERDRAYNECVSAAVSGYGCGKVQRRSALSLVRWVVWTAKPAKMHDFIRFPFFRLSQSPLRNLCVWASPALSRTREPEQGERICRQ